jgi:hypothetical protein
VVTLGPTTQATLVSMIGESWLAFWNLGCEVIWVKYDSVLISSLHVGVWSFVVLKEGFCCPSQKQVFSNPINMSFRELKVKHLFQNEFLK